MKKQRPVNLQLNTISFPPTAIVSILHRVSGVGMFVGMVFVIWAWATALQSAEDFMMVQDILGGVFGKIIAIGTVSLLIFHMVVGIRHVIMDMGYWEELDSGNASAKASIVIWLILTVLTGVAIW